MIYKNTTNYSINVYEKGEFVRILPGRTYLTNFYYDIAGLELIDPQTLNYYDPLEEQNRLNTTYVNLATFNPVVEQLNANDTTDVAVYNTLVSVSGSLKSEIDSITGGVVSDGNSILSSSVSGSIYRTQQERNSDVVNVKDFGAVGDGVTDDTVAIQNALNFKRSSGGGTVRIPEGIYIVKSSIFVPSRVRLIGEGTRSSIIKWGNVDTTGYLNGVVYATETVTDDFLFSHSVKSLMIDGNGVAGVCLALRGIQENCSYEDLVVVRFKDAGIDVMPFVYQNNRATFSEIHSIQEPGSPASVGFRADNMSNTTIRRLTTGLTDEDHAKGLYLKNGCINNFISNIHMENCIYGIYELDCNNNNYISITATNHHNTGLSLYKSNDKRVTMFAVRAIEGFSNIVENINGSVPVTDINVAQDLQFIISGSNQFRVFDSVESGYAELGTLLLRGIELRSGVTGNGQGILRAYNDIQVGQSKDVIIDLDSGATSFAGKICGFSLGDERFMFESYFSGYMFEDGTIAGGRISTPTTDHPAIPITISIPTQLNSPTPGKFKLTITNGPTYAVLLEIKIEISRQNKQVKNITF